MSRISSFDRIRWRSEISRAALQVGPALAGPTLPSQSGTQRENSGLEEPRNCEQESESDGGGEGQNRTVDTTIFSRMLYQLSYLATPGTACGTGQKPAPGEDRNHSTRIKVHAGG